MNVVQLTDPGKGFKFLSTWPSAGTLRYS